MFLSLRLGLSAEYYQNSRYLAIIFLTGLSTAGSAGRSFFLHTLINYLEFTIIAYYNIRHSKNGEAACSATSLLSFCHTHKGQEEEKDHGGKKESKEEGGKD
jgi:hypothetical protein